MSKVNENMLIQLMKGLFCVRQSPYNLRNPTGFAVPSKNSVYNGSESISYLRPKILN